MEISARFGREKNKLKMKTEALKKDILQHNYVLQRNSNKYKLKRWQQNRLQEKH